VKVLLAHKFFYRKGGGEVYFFDLMTLLQAHGHNVIPFAMRHELNSATDYDRFFVDSTNFEQKASWGGDFRKAMRILYSREAKRKLAALLDLDRPDVAHIHNIYHQISPSILPVLKRRGFPVVMTVHDLKLLCPNYKMRTQGAICERCKPHRFYQAVLHRCVKDSVLASAVCAVEAYLHTYSGVYETNVDIFITPSRFYQSKLVEWGMPEKKIVFIPNFTDLNQFPPEYGGEDYCVYFGRLAEEKGLLTLVEAMRRIRRGTLLIVGDGPLSADLQDAINKYRLKNVRLTGFKEGAELANLIRRARFTVFPSEWYENCSMALIESYAWGKPVLGANIGGISEMIDEEETGLLFEPFSVEDLSEKIEYLLGHEDVAMRMGKKARARAEKEYGSEQHYSALMRLYSKCIGSESERKRSLATANMKDN
jgi:glycosyltransferase involved in cell wall biosynthesis